MKEIDKNSIDDLLVRYLAGSASENEVLEVEDWLMECNENREYFKSFKNVWKMSAEYKEYQKIDTESSLTDIKSKIDFNQKDTTKVRSLWLAVKIAAVVVVSIGFYFVFRTYSGNTSVTQMAIVESGNQKKQVNLPDGSIVTLNNNSVIEYPIEFEDKERKVKFSGEAYFEVEASKNYPFIIETDKSQTRVVGTEFNLKARAQAKEHSIVVTEGIVEFSGKTVATKKPVRLVKGDKADLGVELNRSVNTNPNFMSWKTGVLHFDNQPLERVLEDLSNHYNVRFLINDASLTNLYYAGTLDNQELFDIIEIIELTFNVDVEKVENTYLVKGKTN